MILKTLRNFFFVGIVLILNACSQAGWVGYYTEKGASDKYISVSTNTTNTRTIKISNQQEIWLEMPRDCSGFKFAGIGTPLTPPIPLPNFRALTFATFMGSENPCHYFLIETRPKTKATLKLGDKIFEPEIREGLYGYTKYIFPVRAKNLDSGIIILEKDGQKVEVPFEYKYFKFWY